MALDAHRGLGDMYDPNLDPMAQYWKQIGSWPGEISQEIIGKPTEPLPQAEQARIEEMARVMAVTLTRMVQYTRNPAYLQPPLRSYVIDMYKNGELALPPAMAAPIQVMRVVIPKGGIGIIKAVGTRLEAPAAHVDVLWFFRIDNENMQVPVEWYDGAAARETTYVNFRPPLGDIQDPPDLSMPIILTENQAFSVFAQNQNLVVWHDAVARIKGWLYIPQTTSVDRISPSSMAQ